MEASPTPSLPARWSGPCTHAGLPKVRKPPPAPGVPGATHPAPPPPPRPPLRTRLADCGCSDRDAKGLACCAATWREDGLWRLLRAASLTQPVPGVRELTRLGRSTLRPGNPAHQPSRTVIRSPGGGLARSQTSGLGEARGALRAAHTGWELVRNADSRAHPRPAGIRICILTSSPGDSRIH